MICRFVIPEEGNREVNLNIPRCLRASDIVAEGTWYYRIETLIREGNNCHGTLSRSRPIRKASHSQK